MKNVNQKKKLDKEGRVVQYDWTTSKIKGKPHSDQRVSKSQISPLFR